MNDEAFKKEVFFWSNDLKNEYGDSTYTVPVPVPRATYRCKATATREKGLRTTKHLCKFVTDHPTAYCECICGITFNEKENVA